MQQMGTCTECTASSYSQQEYYSCINVDEFFNCSPNENIIDFNQSISLFDIL